MARRAKTIENDSTLPKPRKKRKPMTAEQKKAAGERLAKAREKRLAENPPQYKNIAPEVLAIPDDGFMSMKKVRQWIKTQKDIASSSEKASRRHGIDTKIKNQERAKGLNARGYIRWLNNYLESGIFAGEFIGEYENIPVTRKIVAGPREGCKIRGGKVID